MRLIDADKVNFNQDWFGGERRTPQEIIDIQPTIDAELVRHGHWTDDHKCSICGGGVFSETVNIRPTYDYDWDENLVMNGDYEYDIEYHETDWCSFCGAKMDEVSE